MTEVTQTAFKRLPIGRYMLVGMLFWTVIIVLSLVWNVLQLQDQAEYLATVEARANWDKDLAFRRWATRHGGLYVRPDERTPPNPYLAHLPERDVVTSDGMKLTLMNPAYMMRQMTDEFEEMYGIKGSITARTLLNPINKADPWELKALKRFDQGESEIVEVTELNDEPHLRLMRPMVMRKGCVKCHGDLGLKEGDIHGGVSVSIPLAPYRAVAEKNAWQIAGSHGGIWLLGLMGISYIVQRGRRFEDERAHHEQAIKNIATGVSTATGDTFFCNMVEHIAGIFNADYVFIGVLKADDPEYIRTLSVCAYGEIVDNIEYSLQDTPCHNIMTRQACAYPDNVQQRFPKDKLLAEMNVEAYIGKPIYDSSGKPLGIMVVLNSKSLDHSDEMEEFLEIFAARASGEIERLRAEQALRRSQKMEAIGQLSGGIAHDFNNQLGIILGYLDFLKNYVASDEKPSKWVEISINATLRCTDLTRQLLSFSRTQTDKKVVVDINARLRELGTMFARSLTPAIEVQYSLADELWPTEIDPGEFQDAILNMVINARDAMPNGGKLLIETSNKQLDAEYAAFNPDAHAGDYIQLVLSDTGSGMNRSTQEHIFEPFYTTKEKDKGTGLGMSMVYGFVKRFGGFIQIYSEVDIGTTLRIYLPRADTTETNITGDALNDQNLPTGNETILIVDDEINLLHLADDYLSTLGYKTYLAENSRQALDMLEKHKDIDCLFSDVVMPGGINGYELAELAVKNNAELKVLLTSGFTSKTIAQNGQVRFTAQMLSKPYRKADLAQCIRRTLDEKTAT